MMSDWTLIWLLFLLAINFFSLVWVTYFNPPRHFVGSVFVFAFTQILFLGLGWSIAYMMQSFFQAFSFSISGVLLVFIGIKRFLTYFTTKKEMFHFQINRPTDALGIGIAASIEGLLMGMALFFLTETIYLPLIISFVFTIILSILGYWIAQKTKNTKLSLLIKLVSGIGIIIFSLPLF